MDMVGERREIGLGRLVEQRALQGGGHSKLSWVGAGQFYNSDWKKALAIIAIMWIGAVATAGVASFAAWVWAMIDAYKVAKGEWKPW